MRRTGILTGALLAAAAVLAACSMQGTGGPSSSASNSPSTPVATPTANPTAVPIVTPTLPASQAPFTQVTSPAQAAAVVFASEPIFGSMTPPGPATIGQSTSYEAAESGDSYTVRIMLGSGDCPAGCIHWHTWIYVVSRDGTVTLESKSGDEVETTIDQGTADDATVTVRLVAGPVCPVEQNPPNPACAPKPMPGIEAVLRDPTGAEVDRGHSDAQGQLQFSVPGGAYYVEPAAATGVMGQAAPVAFSVPGGRSATVTLYYDTGIR